MKTSLTQVVLGAALLGLSSSAAVAQASYARAKRNVIACYELEDWKKLNKLYLTKDKSAVAQFLATRPRDRKCISITDGRPVYIQLRNVDQELCIRPIGDLKCAWTSEANIDER